MKRKNQTTALTRRHLLVGGLVAPLLPTSLLAAVSSPRFRRRRKTPDRALERQLFTSDTPPTLGAVQAFIDRLWLVLQAPLSGAVPWRQYDLLAGLALRYGRPALLPLLAARLPVASTRADKWLAADSRWRRRWGSAPSLSWSWPEAGHLTRRALPLTLPLEGTS